MPPAQKSDLLQGTLDLLILQVVSLAPLHGFAIAKRIEQVSGDTLRIEHGSLYPALYRLEEQGLLSAHWAQTGQNRKAKYYELTRAGQSRLETELDHWRKLSTGVERVIAKAGA
ncbi:MAG: PadR family transcriptional regulator [Acidobacteria bacterium]|nr:PadR family transcriptional regulator [Acidobacteriota bacterium]